MTNTKQIIKRRIHSIPLPPDKSFSAFTASHTTITESVQSIQIGLNSIKNIFVTVFSFDIFTRIYTALQKMQKIHISVIKRPNNIVIFYSPFLFLNRTICSYLTPYSFNCLLNISTTSLSSSFLMIFILLHNIFVEFFSAFSTSTSTSYIS